MKLCKDCAHFDPGAFETQRAKIYFAKCNKTVDPVDGGAESYCSIQRGAGWLWARIAGRCGEEGRWWEPLPADKAMPCEGEEKVNDDDHR